MNSERDPTPPSGFGRARRDTAEDRAGVDFGALRGGGTEVAAEAPRWMLPVLLAILVCLLLGGVYFIHAMLAFKDAIEANITAIYGPYPPFAAFFVIIPAYCGVFYFLLDFLRLKTGAAPFSTLRGSAICLGAALVLLALIYPPMALIRHNDNEFALGHGYIRCASLFDPHHTRVYALRSYVDLYGCPTVTMPQ
jgi:hypothetical protein